MKSAKRVLGIPDHSIPGLDGLRAASILFVLLAHLKSTNGFPGYPAWWWHLGDVGNLGVRVFFVISGFLITHLLLREEQRTGGVSLRRFYIRRAYRILPALWCFLLVMFAARAAGLVVFSPVEWLQGATFTENYTVVGFGTWNLGHLWSLSVEEQFYLFWPSLFVFAPSKYRMRILVIAILMAPAIRVGLLWHATATGGAVPEAPPYGFFASMDALAAGCMLALIKCSPATTRLLDWVPTGWSACVLPIIIVVLNGLSANTAVFFGLVLPSVNIAIACLIHAATQSGLGGLQWLLDSSAMQWIGRLSYSLYLWQQPFLNPRVMRWFTRFPVSVIAAFVAATISYYLIERPALARRPVDAERGGVGSGST